MTEKSRLRLEIEGRVAFLLIIVVMFPNIYAQHRNDLGWLQSICICIVIACGIVGLRAAFLLKKCTEPDTPLLKRLCWISGVAYVVIVAGGFGVFALLAHTRRAFIIWLGLTAFLVVILFLPPRKRSNQTLQPTAGRSDN